MTHAILWCLLNGETPERLRLYGALPAPTALDQVRDVPFLSLLPVGWYSVSFDAAVEDSGTEAQQDDVETVRQLIPVFD